MAALGFGDPDLAEYLRRWLFLAAVGDADVLVADDDGAVVGRVVVDLARGQVLALEVAPGRRRGGIGRRLMAAAERSARERGHRRLTLLVEETNDRPGPSTWPSAGATTQRVERGPPLRRGGGAGIGAVPPSGVGPGARTPPVGDPTA